MSLPITCEMIPTTTPVTFKLAAGTNKARSLGMLTTTQHKGAMQHLPPRHLRAGSPVAHEPTPLFDKVSIL